MQCGLTRCRWCVEGDLGAVRAKHGVPAASHPEGVQAVGVQVAHDGAGSVHPVCGPPQPAVFAVLLGRGLAQPEVRAQSAHSSFSLGSQRGFSAALAPTCGTPGRGGRLAGGLRAAASKLRPHCRLCCWRGR